MEYFIIGERELVLAFKLVGVDGTVCENKDESLDAFNRITGKGSSVGAPVAAERPKVLILTENISDMIEDEVLAWQKSGNYPLIVEIPGIEGHLKGRKTLTDAIREAIGIQV